MTFSSNSSSFMPLFLDTGAVSSLVHILSWTDGSAGTGPCPAARCERLHSALCKKYTTGFVGRRPGAAFWQRNMDIFWFFSVKKGFGLPAQLRRGLHVSS